MSNTLDKKVLLAWLDSWRDFCGESCIKADCVMGIEECEPAYDQIVALIGASKEVTEEWIEKKKEKMIKILGMAKMHTESRNFIRQLVEEIRGK